MGLTKLTVCHKRGDCIGCGSCALLAPRQWSMNSDDGKADLVSAVAKGEFMVAQVDPIDAEANKAAAAACPMRIIRIDKGG